MGPPGTEGASRASGSLADPGALGPAGSSPAPARVPRARLTLRWLRRIAGIVPFGGYVTLGLLLPMAAVAIGAFQGNNGNFTLSNLHAATHGAYLHGFWQSIILSVVTAILPGIFGLLIAYAVFTAKRGTILRQAIVTASGVFANFGGCGWPSCSSPLSAPAGSPPGGWLTSGSTRTTTGSTCTPWPA
jgi:hypothetical protein